MLYIKCSAWNKETMPTVHLTIFNTTIFEHISALTYFFNLGVFITFYSVERMRENFIREREQHDFKFIDL